MHIKNKRSNKHRKMFPAHCYKRWLILGSLVLLASFLGVLDYMVFHQSTETGSIQPKVQINQKATAQLPYYKSIPILMYHHIKDYYDPKNQMENEMSTTSADFQAEMLALQNNGYKTITFKEMRQGNIPTKPIVISFDDGYQNNYEVAYPILKKNNQVGTFYIISDATSGNGYMTKKEIRTMADNGMEIGSHTANHYSLTNISPIELKNQLAKSKKDLELIIGKPVETFSYPFGQYNDEVVAAVRETGYKTAVTIDLQAKSNNLLTLPRINVQSWDNDQKVLNKIKTFSKDNNRFTWDYTI